MNAVGYVGGQYYTSPILLLGETTYSRLFRGDRMRFAIIGDDKNVEDELILKEALEELPEQTLAIIAMRASGFTQEQTASVLGVSRTSVGTIERAMYADLRERLGNAQ